MIFLRWRGIQFKVESRMEEVQKQIDSFGELVDTETYEKKKKEMKIKAKTAWSVPIVKDNFDF